MADNSFTFWENMQDTIEVYNDPVYKYKMYDALVNYGLYGIWPENDGSSENQNLTAFVQGMVVSLDRSRNYNAKKAEEGANGGRSQKVNDEDFVKCIQGAALRLGRVPKRDEVVDEIFRQTGEKISAKTVSRRFNDAEKKKIALEILGQNGDKTNVPQGQNNMGGHRDIKDIEGQNRDISYVSEGQNEDKTDVPDVPFTFNF